MDDDYTTMRIARKLKDELELLGRKGESFNSIVEKLVERYNERTT